MAIIVSFKVCKIGKLGRWLGCSARCPLRWIRCPERGGKVSFKVFCKVSFKVDKMSSSRCFARCPVRWIRCPARCSKRFPARWTAVIRNPAPERQQAGRKSSASAFVTKILEIKSF